MIGAGTSILGNIKVGDGAKIGAGSVVLRDIPHGVTAVGAPARIIGRSERRPGSKVDAVLRDVPPIIPTTIEGSEENETIEGRDAPLQGNFSLIKSISFENVIDDPLCPFRGLSQASSAAAAKCRKQSLGSSNEILLSHKMVSEEEVENSTPAMISHHTFRCALQEAGMTIPQAGEVFFEMLSDGHGVWEGPGGGGYFRPTQKFWNTLEKYLRTYCPSMDKNHLVDVMTNTKKTRCSEKGSKQEI
uniref:Serine O-acetyltransferase n=1 Tax=Corethron hystrix TaxID=216773 RepID=A0A7S1FTU7_9STRA